SGTVSGTAGSKLTSGEINISLAHIPDGTVESTTEIDLEEKARTFTFHGVPDGEYEIVAELKEGNSDGAASAPRRVAVKGRDLAGVDLLLVPLGSIAGKVTFEA